MHQHGVVHRDLKLENVVYESTAPDADIFIIDYGLSKVRPPVEQNRFPLYIQSVLLTGDSCRSWFMFDLPQSVSNSSKIMPPIVPFLSGRVSDTLPNKHSSRPTAIVSSNSGLKCQLCAESGSDYSK